ncbi:MAG TPA: polysaccharide deacetylase family protein [Candidatus Dormibacteraeota bacterium]|nr:polysaccharide deacetylase family protein [Candidatus Dormibacteraeota bacterium]
MSTPQPYATTICMSVDYDAVSTWTAAGQTGLRTLSRGEFAEYATPQLLEIFKRYEITTSWYIPGTTALQYPDSVAQVAGAGHEIANHTLRHEDIAALPLDQMRYSLTRTNEILERITGQRPVGARLTGADLGDGTCLKVMADEGFRYDSSLLGGYRPFWAPSPHTIDAEGLIRRAEPLDMVELPFVWILTDFSQFEFHYGPPQYRALLLNARQVEEVWRDEIDDLIRRDPAGFLMFALHPQVIGRGSRLAMLERVIEYALERKCRFATAAQIADEFRADEDAKQRAGATHVQG